MAQNVDDVTDLREEPFPAVAKTATGTVNGVDTDVSLMNFSDKIMITISQDGRLAQWIQVPLSSQSPALMDMAALPRASTLPSAHLTPKTLLGAGGDERNTVGQLYAAQIASHLAKRNPEDGRTLLLGLGLEKAETAREAFFDVLELVQRVL